MAQASIRKQLEAVWKENPPPAPELTGDSEESEEELLEAEPQGTEAGEEPEIEAGAGDGEEPAEEQGKEWYTPAELAEALGWEPSDLFTALRIPVDDADEPISLEALKDGRHEVARTKAELEEQRQQLQQAQQQMAQQYQQWLQGSGEVSKEVQQAQHTMSEIEARYAQLKELEQKAIQEEDHKTLSLVTNALIKIGGQYAGAQEALQTAQQRDMQARQQYLMQDRQRHDMALLERVPEWRDPEVAQRESDEIAQMLVQQAGFRPEEIGAIYDHRARWVARMALKGLQAEQAKGQLRAAPKKVLRPGGGATAAKISSAKVKAVVQRAQRPNATMRERQEALRAMAGSTSPKRGRRR